MPDGDKPVLVLDALEALLEFSLVRRDERTEPSRRFTMPQALRDFARGDLEVLGEAEAVRRRHADHVLDVADKARVSFMADPAERASASMLEAEIRPALAWASAHDPELHRRLVCALGLGRSAAGMSRRRSVTPRRHATSELPADEIDAWVGNCRAYALDLSGRGRRARPRSSP